MALVASSLWEVYFSFQKPLSSWIRLHLRCTYLFCILAPDTVREESVLQDIQPDELHAKMQDPNFLEEAQLIDVREPEEVYAITS